MDKAYLLERNLVLCGAVGVCAMSRSAFIHAVLGLPTLPISATIDLVGIPAVVAAVENAEIARVYNNATIAAIDGMPIVKKARNQGIECDRCAAPDIMGPLFKESIRCGKTHYFYGGKNEAVLERLRANLQHDYEGIVIRGMYSPPFRPLTDEEDALICEEINRLSPDFLWVGIGAPKQEIWMQEHCEKIHGCIMLGVGAGFDFFAGTLDKAPAWMEKRSLEWLYRFYKEPRRLWRRYLLGGIKYCYYSLLGPIKKEKDVVYREK